MSRVFVFLFFSSAEFVFPAFRRSPAGLKSVRRVCPALARPRRCLSVCLGTFTVPASKLCSQPSVSLVNRLSSPPLREQQGEATRRQIDFDLFCFPSYFHTLDDLLLGFSPHLGILSSGSWFPCLLRPSADIYHF